MQAMTRLREGDVVQVMAGRAKGKTAKILRINPKREWVYLEKVNMVKRHTKPNQKNPQGGIVEKEAPIHWSSVMLLCGKCSKPVRFRQKVLDGVKKRTCIKCGAEVGK